VVWGACRPARAVSRDEILRRFAELPDTFPQAKRYAAELASGAGHDRFDFTINLIHDGLEYHSDTGRADPLR